MEKTTKIEFEHQNFSKRLKSMLLVDFRRMFTMRLLYIMLGTCFVIPILILIMTTLMDGSVNVDPQTGVETVIEGFKNVWQVIGTVSGDESSSGMGITAMCNINLLYFFVAIMISLFVSEDFKSGYAKNLFTVRAKKTDYVFSKTLVGFVVGAFMFFAFFIGTMIGGAISGLPFELDAANIGNVVMSMLSKIFLVAVFVPIALAVSVAAKQKTWMSIVGSMAVGMLLYMMIPMLTPLDATILNVLICLVGGTLFSVGLGSVSNIILKKTSLV